MAQARSDSTKAALVRAAFQLFGEKGFAGTSTRELAAAANTNIASITYHFGGKAGLRVACAEVLSDRLSQMRGNPDSVDVPDIIKTAETTFEALALRQAFMLLRHEDADFMIRFLFREAHDKTEIFDQLYETFFGPTFELLLTHWADAIGIDQDEAHENRTKLTVFSIIGQMAYFRVAQPVVARHMHWQGYQPDEALQVLPVLQQNIRAIIASHRSAK